MSSTKKTFVFFIESIPSAESNSDNKKSSTSIGFHLFEFIWQCGVNRFLTSTVLSYQPFSRISRFLTLGTFSDR